MSLPFEIAVKIAKRVIGGHPELVEKIRFEKDPESSIAEALANSKLFDWISADDITPDQYDNLLYQFTRGLDEDLLTVIRNPQTLVFAPDDNLPSSALPDLDIALLAGAIILPAIYLGAAYVRNRDITRLSQFTYAREQQRGFGKTIKTKFGIAIKTEQNTNSNSESKTIELEDFSTKNERTGKTVKTTNKLEGILKELHQSENYIPIPIINESGELLDCLLFPKLKPTSVKKLSQEADPGVTKEEKTSLMSENVDDTNVTDSNQNKSESGFFAWTKTSKLAKTISILWTSINQYSMFYWLGWGFLFFFTGSIITTFGLGAILLFGLPLVPSLPYLVWKLKQNFSATNDALNKAKEKNTFDNKIINQYYVVTKVGERYRKVFKLDAEITPEHITAANNSVNVKFRPTKSERTKSKEDVAARRKEVADYIKQLKGETVWSGKTVRIIRSTFFGFLSGFMGASFGLWAITDLLGIVFKITLFTAAVTPVTGALVLGGILAISISVGIYLAIYRGREAAKEHQQLKDNIETASNALRNRDPQGEKLDKVSSFDKFAEKAAEAKSIENRIANLRNTLLRQCKLDQLNNIHTYENKINAILKYSEPLDFPKFDGERYSAAGFSIHSDRFFRNYTTPGVWTWFKKRFWDLASFVEGAGTGSFIVRYLIKGGAISVGLSVFLAINPPLLVTIAVTAAISAVVIGALKLYRYRANEQLRMDNKFVEEVQVRAKCLEEEISALKAQEAYLVTRMANYSDERSAAERASLPAREASAPAAQSAPAIQSTDTSLPLAPATKSTKVKQSVSFAPLPRDGVTSEKTALSTCRHSFFSQGVVVSKEQSVATMSHDEQVNLAQSLTRTIAADFEKLFKPATTKQKPGVTSCAQESNDYRTDKGNFLDTALAVKIV